MENSEEKRDVKVTVGCHIPFSLKEKLKQESKEKGYDSVSKYIYYLIETGLESEISSNSDLDDAEEKVISLTEMDLDNIETRMLVLLDNHKSNSSNQNEKGQGISIKMIRKLLNYPAITKEQKRTFQKLMEDPILNRKELLLGIASSEVGDDQQMISRDVMELLSAIMGDLPEVTIQTRGLLTDNLFPDKYSPATGEIAVLDVLSQGLHKLADFESRDDLLSQVETLKEKLQPADQE